MTKTNLNCLRGKNYWKGQINTAGANCSNDVNNLSLSLPLSLLPDSLPPFLPFSVSLSLSPIAPSLLSPSPSLSLFLSLSFSTPQSLVLHFFLWNSVSSRLLREWPMTPSITIIMPYHFPNADRERELLFFNKRSIIILIEIKCISLDQLMQIQG